MSVLWEGDSEAFADGFVAGVVLYEFGVGTAEEFSIYLYVFVLELVNNCSHLNELPIL